MSLSKMALSSLLQEKRFPVLKNGNAGRLIKELQLKILRIQQGIWHAKRRAIIVFEGMDAAGKGGAIRYLTMPLDPRGVRVHSIGPPTETEQETHYLYRFWRDLPKPGTIAIFDRSWYGRVLVERVEKLTPKKRWKEAYREINEFENLLIADGVDLVKIFLAIHPDEQLRRFEARLKDPYKQWKISREDLDARAKWKQYVKAGDEMFLETDRKNSPWNLIPGDSKDFARVEVLKVVTQRLSHHGAWIENAVAHERRDELKSRLKKLKEIV